MKFSIYLNRRVFVMDVASIMFEIFQKLELLLNTKREQFLDLKSSLSEKEGTMSIS